MSGGSVTRTSLLLSSALSAPRLSCPTKGSGFTCCAEIHAEILDGWLRLRIDDGAGERGIGDLQIRFQKLRGEVQGFLVVDKPISRNRVGRNAVGEVVFNAQQFLKSVAVLRDSQAADQTVFRRHADTRGVHVARDPLHHLFAFGSGRLGHAFGRHGSVAHLSANGFPGADLAIFEGGIELIDANPRGGHVCAVADHAVLIEERLDEFLKFDLVGVRGCRRGLGWPVKGGPEESGRGEGDNAAGGFDSETEIP